LEGDPSHLRKSKLKFSVKVSVLSV
jgi:hypothetical protein